MPDALGRYIARATQPLPPLTELDAAHEALSALTNIVGAARIVAIGESFHHTHEQLVIREHLVRHLVSRLGFNVIMLEVINPGPNAIDYFVRGGAGDAEDALIKAGARMWRNRETAALMRWIRTYNAAEGAKTVSVRGLDVLAIGPSMRAVADQIATADAQRVSDLSSGFNIDGRADQTAYNQLNTDERALLRRVFSEANATFSSRANSFERDLGATAYEIVREQTLVVTQAIEMLEAGARGWTEGFALRDAAMADAVTRQIARARADDKFIILSHNTHIATVAPVGSLSHAPMGEHLKRRFGEAYFTLGAAFGRAQFDQPIYGVGDFPGQAGTADHHIAALGHPAALVDLRGAAQDQPMRLQGVGLGPETYAEYPRLSAFDALVYVAVLTNAQQLIQTELTMDAAAIDTTRR